MSRRGKARADSRQELRVHRPQQRHLQRVPGSRSHIAVISCRLGCRRADEYRLQHYELETLRGLELASLGLGQRDEARAAFAEMLELALTATKTHSLVVAGLSGIALAAEPAAADRAARLRGAVASSTGTPTL